MRRNKQLRRFEILETRRVLDSTVVFNEVMYNPIAEESDEWIELHNQMSVDMDLSGWSIRGIDFTFPEGTRLPGREYLVVAKDPERLRAATGLESAFGPFASRLDNGGESLELLNVGVPVATFGQSAFPAFWSRCHANRLNGGWNITDPTVIAKQFAMSRAMNLSMGYLVANPIPEHAEIPSDVINPMIDQALADAQARGMTGATNTPYVLQRIFELTDGQSLEANISLVLNNARLAAEIAVSLANLSENK